MTIKECYSIIGNYDEAIGRLGSERLIEKYLNKFLKDESFSSFCSAYEQGDFEQAFINMHNLKGLFLNLSITQAGESASELCEALRHKKPIEEIAPLAKKARADYEEVEAAVKQLFNA